MRANPFCGLLVNIDDDRQVNTVDGYLSTTLTEVQGATHKGRNAVSRAVYAALVRASDRQPSASAFKRRSSR